MVFMAIEHVETGCILPCEADTAFWLCRSHFMDRILPSKQNICITFVQCWTNVEDVGPTLYKFYTNVLCLLGTSSPDI